MIVRLLDQSADVDAAERVRHAHVSRLYALKSNTVATQITHAENMLGLFIKKVRKLTARKYLASN